MFYSCVSKDQWDKDMKPIEKGSPSVFELNA